MSERIAISIGMKFARFTVLEELSSEKGRRRLRCRCDCGTERIVWFRHLRSGASQSCGCRATEALVKRSTIHGCARRGKKTTEFQIWTGMWARCTNSNAPLFKFYGARGIIVCDRWSDFSTFLADVGLRPSKRHSIDRIDNSKGYFPENVRWATREQQARNTRRARPVTIGGETKPLKDWAELKGLPYKAVHLRIQRGWSPLDALTKPLKEVRT